MKNVVITANKLNAIWHKVYIVGSYNVNILLQRESISDIDLAASATPDEIKKVLKVVGEIGIKYGTLLVMEWDETFEITTFRRDIWSLNQRWPNQVQYTRSLEEDAKRRDFTFNAIYFEPLEKLYVNPVWWIQDLEMRLIRFVWDIRQRLDEDILRILRYVRFKNKYWFEPAEPFYDTVISERIAELESISSYRIKQELDKILLDPNNVISLMNLRNYWFLKRFLLDGQDISSSDWDSVTGSIMLLNRSNCHDVDLYWTALLYRMLVNGMESNQVIISNILTQDFPFGKKSQNRILWLIENIPKVAHIGEMKLLAQYETILHPFFQDLALLYDGANLTDQLNGFPKLMDFRDRFLEKFKNVKLLTGGDIARDFPMLKWMEIRKRLDLENSGILEHADAAESK